MSFSAETPTITQCLRPLDGKSAGAVNSTIDGYLRFYDRGPNRKAVTDDVLEADVEERRKNALAIVNAYYDVATDFYEYGWGEGIHFSVLRQGESVEHSAAKHEYYLAMKLGLKPGETVLDVGCGIGGPARHIASLSEANVTGLNVNEYQLERARYLTEKAKLDHLCTYVKADFNHMPYREGHFDKAYAIEATVHSASLCSVYSEVLRVLKPGGMFAVYEWSMTDNFNPRDPQHRSIKAAILEGTGLADIVSEQEVLAAARQAGFEILENRDRALEPTGVPWHKSISKDISLFGLTMHWGYLQSVLTLTTLFIMETLRLAPRGSVKVYRMLGTGARGLAAGGRKGIFTPMYLLVLRKPSN